MRRFWGENLGIEERFDGHFGPLESTLQRVPKEQSRTAGLLTYRTFESLKRNTPTPHVVAYAFSWPVLLLLHLPYRKLAVLALDFKSAVLRIRCCPFLLQCPPCPCILASLRSFFQRLARLVGKLISSRCA